MCRLQIRRRSVHIDSIELASGAIAGVFLCVDASFFLANLVKVADGGYVPLLLGSLVHGVMLIWHRGSTTVAQIFRERPIPVNEFMSSLKAHEIRRVPGTAVFLTSVQRQASREATGVTRLAFLPGAAERAHHRRMEKSYRNSLPPRNATRPHTTCECPLSKLGIEFANFLQIRDEVRVRRSGIFRPDISGALERLGTEQLFDESGAVC